MKNKQDTLQFKFDISTFKLLGRELITDKITALVELVKNCYDANAENVWISFINSQDLKKGKIIIKDDGIGMNVNEIRNKWMIIGTNSKRENSFSPEPYSRKYVGEKGVGRFAVDKLGSKLVMTTKKATENETVVLTIDWREYEEKNKIQSLFSFDSIDKTYFTDVKNDYEVKATEDNSHGTTLEMTFYNTEHIWTDLDIRRAEKELSRLLVPYAKLKYPFNICIKTNENIGFEQIKVASLDKHATYHFHLDFDIENNTQQIVKFDKETGELKTIESEIEKFGGITLDFYYYDENAKRRFKDTYKNYTIDGIKVYRDGLLATPSAEDSDDIKTQRDIFGLDKRRYGGFFDKVGNRDLIIIVQISKNNNPNIIDATNRQDFIENEQSKIFKDFIIRQIFEFEKSLKSDKKKVTTDTKIQLQDFRKDVKTVKDELKNIYQNIDKSKSADNVALKPLLDILETQLDKISQTTSKAYRQIDQLQKEEIRKDNLYLSLMSLQNYSLEISHMVGIVIGKIKRNAEYIRDNITKPERIANNIRFASNIFTEMEKLDKGVRFLLSYADANKDFVEIDIKSLIEKLFTEHYKEILDFEGITPIIEIRNTIILLHNYKFFEDIFENLINNSIKALAGRENKIIKCSANIEDNKFIITFSDNGIGIEEEIQDRIFDMFFTTTLTQQGSGMGLYIVQTRLDSVKGSIELIEPEFETGASFKITLPLNK